MDSGFYAACTALRSRSEALDTIANNLANTSTAGYRARHNVFSSVLATTGDQARLSELNQSTNNYGVLSRTRLDLSQGALQKTGNELDLGIAGGGFFAVQTAAGVRYTRDGSFHTSPQGQLVTAAGDPVLGDRGPITIVGAPVSISADGTISVKGALAGRLQVVEFAATQNLESAGETYYSAPAGAARPATGSQIEQGSLESSNVNPVSSVVELISAQREAETMRHVLTMFNNEMDKTAVQDLPRVG